MAVLYGAYHVADLTARISSTFELPRDSVMSLESLPAWKIAIPSTDYPSTTGVFSSSYDSYVTDGGDGVAASYGMAVADRDIDDGIGDSMYNIEDWEGEEDAAVKERTDLSSQPIWEELLNQIRLSPEKVGFVNRTAIIVIFTQL